MQMLSAVVWTQVRNNKKSLFSSLQNPFRSQLSQREHCFSVWKATANETSESHLSPSRDRLSSSTIFVLSVKTEGTVLCQSGSFAHLLSKVWGTYLQDVSLQYSEEGNSQLLSLRNNKCKRLSLQKTTNTEMAATFSLKATQWPSPCSGSCVSCSMGTLHYTAQQWQHGPLEQRKRFGA